jgi:NADP-dependent 3-hydroxy acid dehydrogenase YdfG
MTMKFILITGTSSGIGGAAAQYFLKWSGHVSLAASP